MEPVRSRFGEDYLVETRNGRRESFDAWKSRIEYNDMLARGDFPVIQPDGSPRNEKPNVSNLVDIVPRDLARLAREEVPSYRCPTTSDAAEAVANAELRSVISEGYFEKGNWEVLRPQLVMDFAMAGAAFVMAWKDDSSEYPRMTRIDPRAAYPEVFNGELLDLLVIQKLKVRQVELKYPDLNIYRQWATLNGDENKMSTYVEVWDYICAKGSEKLIALVDAGDRCCRTGT